MITVLLPLHNPDDSLLISVKSLANQSDIGFKVLISDNHSSGNSIGIIEQCEQILKGKNIETKIVSPPFFLDRVQNWNWLHHQAGDGWLKPLFAGDFLKENYIESIKQNIALYPQCKYIYCAYKYITENKSQDVIPNWCGKYIGEDEMMKIVTRYAHQFGPPSAAIYKKDAFVAIGGYNYNLPICADSLFFCTLAATFGAMGIAEPLINFNIHQNRFSKSLKNKNAQTFYEKITYELMVNYYAHTQAKSNSYSGMLKLWWSEVKSHYLKFR